MERLIYGTNAYKIFCGDAERGMLSHAYMLYFADPFTLRDALKLFAVKFFGTTKDSRDGRLILSEGLPDLKVYPAVGKKLSADSAAEIVADAALKPVEGNKKLYIISDFDGASPIFQNKLLKILEEPPAGVYFLLGATSLSPVLPTVRSRVKLLEIPPFTREQILSALDRLGADPRNGEVAEACAGIFGAARNMLNGGWYEEVRDAAREICFSVTLSKAAAVSMKYGDFKLKKELLGEMQRIYFGELKKYARDKDYSGGLSKVAAAYAVESVTAALADLKFNANFSSLLFDLTLRIAQKNGERA